MADATSLHLPPGASPPPPEGQGAPPAPPCGQLVAGHGCYINPQYVTKIEVSSSGSEHFVRAFLANPHPGPAGAAGSAAVLAGPFESEADAFTACDMICQTFWLTYSVWPTGADWPVPEPDPRKPTVVGGESSGPAFT